MDEVPFIEVGSEDRFSKRLAWHCDSNVVLAGDRNGGKYIKDKIFSCKHLNSSYIQHIARV